MKNTFHIEFAESLGLCLFCHCSGDDNPNLIGVWDRNRRVFVNHESVHTPSGEFDLFESKCFCDICGDGFHPQSMADAHLIIDYDCVDDESPWVGFVDNHVRLHVRAKNLLDHQNTRLFLTSTDTNVIAGLLEWSL